MSKLPVLKPHEVISRLEALGFVEVRQRGFTNSSVIQTLKAQRFQFTRVKTFPQFCSARSPETSESRPKSLLRLVDSPWFVGWQRACHSEAALLQSGIIPQKAARDAAHIAVSAVHAMDFY